MNKERDKFLTEAMDECWHEWEGHWTDYKSCFKCGKFDKSINARFVNSNFSTWKGFGKLWEWVQGQEWIEEFELFFVGSIGIYYSRNINPDEFANAVYEYLQSRSN